YIGGARLEHALAEARIHADVGAIVRRLPSFGLSDIPLATNGLEVYWDDGEPIVRILLMSYTGTRPGSGGTLVHWTGRGKSSTSIATWDGDDGDRRVYRARGAQVAYAARMQRQNDGSSVVDLADGQHLVVPTYPTKLASSGKHGLAAPASDTVFCYPECNWQCSFVCSIVCTTV